MFIQALGAGVLAVVGLTCPSALQVVPVFPVVRAFRPFNNSVPGRISWFLKHLSRRAEAKKKKKKCFPPEAITETNC